MKYILYYLATIVPMGILDMIWITGVAKGFYAKHMAGIFSKTFNLVPAAIFYPLYALAVLLLVVLPAISSGSWFEALWRGALLGLAAYATYDLTNQVTIDNWPTIMTIVDILWGTIVTAITSVVAYFIINLIK